MTVQRAERVIHEKDLGIRVRGASQCHTTLLATTQIDSIFCIMRVQVIYMQNDSQSHSPPISVFKPFAMVSRPDCKAHAWVTLSSRKVTSSLPKSILSSNVAL